MVILAQKKTKKSDRIGYHTTISKESYDILEKYSKFEDKEGNLIFKNRKSNVIEFSLELLEKYFNPEKMDMDLLAARFQKDLNMLTVGKPTFLAYISGNYERAFKENIAIELIEWYKGKTVIELSTFEIIESIKDLWMAGNYFYKIDINIDKKGIIQVYFYHDLHSKMFSQFWGDYFSIFLSNLKKCEVETFVRSESLILRILPPE